MFMPQQKNTYVSIIVEIIDGLNIRVTKQRKLTMFERKDIKGEKENEKISN